MHMLLYARAASARLLVATEARRAIARAATRCSGVSRCIGESPAHLRSSRGHLVAAAMRLPSHRRHGDGMRWGGVTTKSGAMRRSPRAAHPAHRPHTSLPLRLLAVSQQKKGFLKV